MRVRAIEDHRGCWPVALMCRVFRVSVAGYYAWRARPESERAAENRALLDDIREVHAASQGRYGSPRVQAALRAQGRRAGRGRIERLMHRRGVSGMACAASWLGHDGRVLRTAGMPSQSPPTCWIASSRPAG